MFARLVVGNHFHACHLGCEIVACMLHIGTHSQVLAGVGVVEPVLSLYVIGLLLLAVERRCKQRHFGLTLCAEHAADGQVAEEGSEYVLLLTVEIYLERLHVLHCAE